MTKYYDHDTYIAAAPEQFRAMLGQLRAQLSRALPDAEEVIKYDLPGFQIGGKIIAGYAAFTKQCGLYVDPGAIADHAGEIASLKLKATKTGITFSLRNWQLVRAAKRGFRKPLWPTFAPVVWSRWPTA